MLRACAGVFYVGGVFSMLQAYFYVEGVCGRIFYEAGIFSLLWACSGVFSMLRACAGVFPMLRACAGVRAFAGVKKKDPKNSVAALNLSDLKATYIKKDSILFFFAFTLPFYGLQKNWSCWRHL